MPQLNGQTVTWAQVKLLLECAFCARCGYCHGRNCYYNECALCEARMFNAGVVPMHLLHLGEDSDDES